MSRSRFRLIRPVVLIASMLMVIAVAAPAHAAPAETGAWSPRLGYVLTTGSVRAALADRLKLTQAQDQALRAIGYDLERVQSAIQRRSDLIVMNGGLTLEQKRALIDATGYNASLASAEDSAADRAAAVLKMTPAALGAAVSEVWEADAAEHRLETALVSIKATPASAIGLGVFHVYATRFWDVSDGVAVPDKYVKYANLGLSRPAGYPSGTYAVNLYWDGIHHGRDNNVSETWGSPKSVLNVKVTDVGPWNVDDNWWNSYADPQRPRRINSDGIAYQTVANGGGGPDFLANQPHLPLGLPESQAAYFDYYGRPSKIPAHTTAWENYWDKKRGYNGQWSGADQFGRQVTQPAAIDLTNKPYQALGMTDNEWIDVVPLWEARLSLAAPVKVSTGPYFTGQRLTSAYCVKNTGTLTGTWDKFTFTLKNGSWSQNPTYQGPVTIAAGMTHTFLFSQIIGSAGTLSAVPQARRAGLWAAITTQTITLKVAKRTVDRIAGTDRYDTAVQMSRKAFPTTAKAVVIATGRTFPDALAGAALAHVEGGPLLLVGAGVSAGVQAEIARLKPTKVFILGSTGAVSSAEEMQVRDVVPAASVTRIAGVDRYETAAKVAVAVAAHNGGQAKDGTAIVATGKSFPDALCASVLSAEKSWPILLTNPSSLPTVTRTAITQLGVATTLLVGGSGVVSDGVAGRLPKCTRLSGPTRYDTAAKVADYAEKKGLGYAYVGLTTGVTFPDALAGGVFAAHAPGMMLITPPTGLPEAIRERLAAHRTVTAHLQAYGSTGAVPDAVLGAAEDALR